MSDQSELLSRFAEAYTSLLTHQTQYDAVCDRREREIARRMGIPEDGSYWRNETEVKTYLAHLKVVDEELGFRELNEKMEDLWGPVGKLVRKMVDAPALDLNAIALKANAVATAFPQLWEKSLEELDWPEELMRVLLEDVCALAGTTLMANKLIKRSLGNLN